MKGNNYMKKHLLLISIPALLALSACNGAIQQTQKDNLYKETTTTGEIFGNVGTAYELKTKRNNLITTTPEDLLEPVIGVQYKAQDDGKYAIRFIGAIASLNVKANWTRGLTQLDGNVSKSLKTVESDVAYTSLKDGPESSITPAEFAEDEAYNYFVVYSMYNIPASELNSYMIAYLTLSDAAEENIDPELSVTSKAKISQIDSEGDLFTVSSSHNYYMHGVLGGKIDTITADTTTKGNNKASFATPLTADDSFYIYENSSDGFNIYNSSILTGDDNPIGNDFKSGTNNKIDVKNTGNYILYLNDSNELWHVNSANYKMLGIDGDWDWTDGVAGVIDYDYDGNGSAQIKFTLVVDEYECFKIVENNSTWYGQDYPVKGGVHDTSRKDSNIGLWVGTYEIYFRINYDGSKQIHIFKNVDSYYLVGKINGNTNWGTTDYNFVKNTKGDTVEYILSSTAFSSGDEMKVMNGNDWRPASNVSIDFSGNKIVYFRPGGDGGSGWYQGTLYFADQVA